MPPALWLIIVPLGTVPIIYLLRRTALGVIVATGVALFAAWLSLRLPPGLVLNLLGRPIELDPLTQFTLALLFMATAILFLTAYPFAQNRQAGPDAPGTGRNLRVVGLATAAIFVAASMTRHVGIAAILFEIAAILTVFTIQGRRLESTRAAQRFLVLISLALPLFLLAAWRIDQYQLSGGAQSAQFLSLTTLLVGLGFALWLAVVPFHGWLTATAAEAAPPAAAFTLIAFPTVALSTLIHLLADAPWLAATGPLAQVIIMAGVLTALIGGLLAAVQRGFSPLLGYAALHDLGCLLVVLGLGGETTVLIILVGLTARALALTLIAACLSAIRLHAAGDGFTEVSGLARRLPIATAGLLVGGLTLAGAPLTIGLPWRWQLLQTLATADPRWPALLILAGLGVAVGYLRGLRGLLPPKSTTERRHRVALFPHEPTLMIILICLLAAACVVLGLFPSLLIEPLHFVSAGISIPIR